MTDIDRSMWVPGMVADITLTTRDGVKCVYGGCYYDGDAGEWVTPKYGRIREEDGPITGVRPWAKIDPENDYALDRLSELIDAALGAFTHDRLRAALRAYVEETWPQKPARIDEPGQWGIVEASLTGGGPVFRWVHDGDRWLQIGGGGVRTGWDTLVDPTLKRDGVES